MASSSSPVPIYPFFWIYKIVKLKFETINFHVSNLTKLWETFQLLQQRILEKFSYQKWILNSIWQVIRGLCVINGKSFVFRWSSEYLLGILACNMLTLTKWIIWFKIKTFVLWISGSNIDLHLLQFNFFSISRGVACLMVIPSINNFSWGIKHLSLNLKVSALDIDIWKEINAWVRNLQHKISGFIHIIFKYIFQTS